MGIIHLALVLIALSKFPPIEPVGEARPQLLIHVMPWFVANEKELGFHWKMRRTTEETRKSGRVSSYYRPMIGPYDSADPDVLDLQMGWMKLSGFDGVLVDWYGVNKHYDYPMMHTRTQAIFEAATRANLNIGVVYEDQSLGFPMQNKLITAQDFPSEVQEVGAFLASDWLKRPNWIKIQGKPAVFNFGPNGFAAKDWQTFRAATGAIQLITLWNRTGDGGFDWPIPLEGIAPQLDFKNRSKSWGIKVSCAFPRFMDYYLAGGEKTGYTRVPDREGKTYRTTLEEAIKPGVDAIQVATWNDWQEGTQIEPSIEFGYRDLIETQKARKRLDSSFRYDPNDLSLPLQIYLARRSGKDRGVLKKANDALFAGNLASSRKFLTMIQNKQ